MYLIFYGPKLPLIKKVNMNKIWDLHVYCSQILLSACHVG